MHANRPWQRGTTRSSLGEEYNLFTPTPPGWIDDKKIDVEIANLIHLAPDHIKNALDDYWEKSRPGRLIEVLFNNIGKIASRTDREKIAELFGKKGGTTPTFQIVAKNLLEFFSESIKDLNEYTINNLDKIDLGLPHKTSREMWKDEIDLTENNQI